MQLARGPNPTIGPKFDPAGPPAQIPHKFSKTVPKVALTLVLLDRLFQCSQRLDAPVEFEEVSLYSQKLREVLATIHASLKTGRRMVPGGRRLASTATGSHRMRCCQLGWGIGWLTLGQLSDPKPFKRGDALKEWFALNGSPTGKISSKAWGTGGSRRLRGTVGS